MIEDRTSKTPLAGLRWRSALAPCPSTAVHRPTFTAHRLPPTAYRLLFAVLFLLALLLLAPLRAEAQGEAFAPSSPSSSESLKARLSLRLGWGFYEKGNFEKALEHFTAASRSSVAEIAMEAQYGMALSLERQKRTADALPLWKELVRRGFRTDETAPRYVEALFEQGRYAEASRWVRALPPEQRRKWRSLLHAKILRRDFHRARRRPSSENLSNFVETYRRDLERCAATDIFRRTGLLLEEAGETDAAIEVYGKLLECSSANRDFRLEILRTLTKWMPFEEARSLLLTEQSGALASSSYPGKLEALEVDLLRQRLDGPPLPREEAEGILERLLSLRPRDPGIRSLAAWRYYQGKRYLRAKELFEGLRRDFPENEDYALGLAYAQLSMGELDSLLAWVEDAPFRETEKWRELKHALYSRKAGILYEKERYPRAERFLRKALALSPGDADALRLLAWTRYHLRRYEEALAIMTKLYEEGRDPEDARDVLLFLERAGGVGEGFRFAGELALREERGAKKAAADFFFRHDAPVLAAQTYEDPDTGYYHADTPRWETSTIVYGRTGDDGTSKLTQWRFPATFHYPFSRGATLSFNATPQHLSSGTAPRRPVAGSFYESVGGSAPLRPLEDDLWVVVPSVALEKEGEPRWSASLGTTPLSGAVSPLPVFELQVEWDRWLVNVHQASVRESILSYAGLKDPYGDGEWGGVVKSGALLRREFPSLSPWWLSLRGGFDGYRGDDVWSNWSLEGAVSAGRSFSLPRGELSLGMFLTASRFERNSEFFTFGHGGYFSPRLLVMGGPSVELVAKPCGRFWLEAALAGGLLHYETEDSPKYPLLHQGKPDGLDPAAREEAWGRFRGEDFTGAGYGGHLRGVVLLSPRWTLTAFGDLNKSSDFTQWQAGLKLGYHFHGISALHQGIFGPREGFF